MASALLGRERQQLFDSQERTTSLHQAAHALVQLASGGKRQLAVAVRIDLDGELKTAAIYRCRKGLAQDLEIKGPVAVMLWIALRDPGAQVFKLLGSFGVRRGRLQGSQAPCMAATSAAKSAFSISMPSPRV